MSQLTLITIYLWFFPVLASACFMKFVPDVDDPEVLRMPWNDPNKKWNYKTISTCSCGKSPDHAWTALVKVKSPVQKTCGGTLINSRFVLSAYSCFVDEKKPVTPLDIFLSSKLPQPSDVDVFVGIDGPYFDISSTSPLEISEVIRDPQYIFNRINEKPISNNVVLLKLKKEIKLDKNSVKPVCVFPSVTLSIDSPLNVPTWGKSVGGVCPGQNGTKQPDDSKLKCLTSWKTKYKDISSCKDHFKDEKSVSDAQFCTPQVAMENDGWPATTELKSGQTFQLGLSSWMDSKLHEGNNANSHEFFTDMASTLSFISYFAEKAGATWCKGGEGGHVGASSSSTGAEDQNLWEGFKSDHRVIRGDCVCGQRGRSRGRVAGGVNAFPNEFKWQTYLEISGAFGSKSDKKITTACGGSLINDRMILTAAHCLVQPPKVLEGSKFPGVSASDITVYLGLHDTRKLQADGVESPKVKAVYFHPLYPKSVKTGILDWDVAVIELMNPVTLNKDKIMPVCLVRSEDVPKFDPLGKDAWVTGWGLLNPDTQERATILQKLQVPIQPLSLCNDIIPQKAAKSSSRVLCAGTLDRFKDAAAGDSGGPLSIEQDGKFVQAGIVSYGYDVGEQTAAYYTDVREVLSFIDYFSALAHAEWCPMTQN